MNQVNTNIVLLLEMLRQMLCAINRTVLSSGTTKRYLEVRKITFDEALRMMIDKLINRLQEREYLTVFLKKINHRLIQSCEGLIFIVLTGIMRRTAIKDITASIARIVGRDSLLKRERVNHY